MTHFLARLVERIRGEAPRVQPIIAPRFAPAPVAEVTNEIEAPAPVASRENETTRRNEPPADKFVRQEIEPQRADENRHEERAVPEPEKLLVPQKIPVSHPLTSIVRRAGPENVAIMAKTNGARPKQSALKGTTTQPGSTPPATIRAAVARGIDPGRPRAERASRRVDIQPNESNNERPIVRVTIGRIDVRAMPAPTAPPRKTPVRSEPKLTLDAYLKARKEGAR
ncbi:MAG: hypothetical protein M3480_02020 [Verrucomicrobiota bacterium]|nr:hypothetical protein [Chthoniobacterales bacterium]MDQ3413746.1 hypothetical protein [Verrucomicrobiota bacterium]